MNDAVFAVPAYFHDSWKDLWIHVLRTFKEPPLQRLRNALQEKGTG